MKERTKDAVDDLKQIPGELRERVEDGTRRFLDQVQSPFEERDDEQVARPQHVVPREDRWAVLPQGSKKATKLFQTKEDAFEAARETAKRQETMLIAHRRDGTVQETRSYRGD